METLDPVYKEEMDPLSFTLYEMRILVELEKTRSIRELARRDQVAPSQISKAVKRLEIKGDSRLLERSVHGVTLTDEGRRTAKIFRQILSHASKLMEESENQPTKVLGVGSTSFLINHLLVRITGDKGLHPWRLRFLEINPDQMTVAGLRHAFDLAFHFGKVDWPASWHQEKIGEINWSLCCRTGHPLNESPSVKDILKYPFVMPSYWSQEGLTLGNDSCPIPMGKRIRGHETSTAEAALGIVRVTDQVGYLPEILIGTYEKLGEVRRLEIRAARTQPKPLFVSARSDAVSEKLFHVLKRSVHKLLTSP
jgi:DNA-binding transcriptional LysR family regulator